MDPCNQPIWNPVVTRPSRYVWVPQAKPSAPVYREGPEVNVGAHFPVSFACRRIRVWIASKITCSPHWKGIINQTPPIPLVPLWGVTPQRSRLPWPGHRPERFLYQRESPIYPDHWRSEFSEKLFVTTQPMCPGGYRLRVVIEAPHSRHLVSAVFANLNMRSFCGFRIF